MMKLSQSKKSNFSHVHKNILCGPVSVINRNQICRHQVSFQRPQRNFWRLQLFGELRSARGHSCGRQYWSPPGRVMTPTVCNCSKYATPTPSPSPSDSPKLNTPPSNWPPPQLERNAALGQPHFVTAAPYPVILDPFYYCHSHPCHLHLQCHHHRHDHQQKGGRGQVVSEYSFSPHLQIFSPYRNTGSRWQAWTLDILDNRRV